MATEVEKIKSGVNATCTVGGSEDWVEADFKFVVTPDTDNAKYSVKVYVRISTPYNMQWNGQSTLKVTCNGVSKSTDVSLSMHSSSGGTTDWDGPASFTFDGSDDLTLKFTTVDLDLTPTTGTNGKPGITHTSDNGNLTHFKFQDYSIDVSSIPLLSAPKISNLFNSNKYDNKSGVSASRTSISLGWDSTGDAIVTSYYRVGSSGDWVKSSSKTSASITGLTAGTSYTIYVYSENSAGKSSTLNITVRTRHEAPVVDLTFSSKKLESLTFKWTSDKSLASCEYKVDDGSWKDLDKTGTSGTLTISGLKPKNSYVVYFRGVSSSTYDSLSSNVDFVTAVTADIAHITEIGDCIFGTNIPITIPDPKVTGLDYSLKLKIWTVGNSTEPSFEFDDITPGTYTFKPTQAQLDKMYKCFTNKNNIPIHFLLYTHGETKDWADTEIGTTLNLTGIAKTAHIGVDNKPRRAQAFIGIGDKPRRAVVWVGDANNTPRRCI